MKSFIAKALFLGSIAFLPAIASAQWSAPTATPPSNNASTPLNVSGTGQTKVGGLTVNTGGAATGFVVSSGNVGIGTASPSSLLSVYGGSAAYGSINIGNNFGSNYNGIWLNGDTSTGNYNLLSSASDKALYINRPSGSAINFRENNGNQMTLASGGYLGIGNASPGAILTVGDGIGVSGSRSISFGNTSGSFYSYMGQSTTNNVGLSWIYSATPSAGFGQLQTFSRSNPLYVDGSQLYLNAQSSAGNVGVGLTNPAYKLDVNGDTYVRGWLRTSGAAGWYSESYGGGWYMSDSTWIRAYNSKPVYMAGGFDTGSASGVGCSGGLGGGYTFRVCGTANASTAFYSPAFYYSSDLNLKKDIAPLDGSLAKVMKLEGVSFEWKDEARGKGTNIGLIAQDVEKVYPELVATDKETGLKSVEYGNLVAPLIEAIKEQQRQIDLLKAEVKALKADD